MLSWYRINTQSFAIDKTSTILQIIKENQEIFKYYQYI